MVCYCEEQTNQSIRDGYVLQNQILHLIAPTHLTVCH